MSRICNLERFWPSNALKRPRMKNNKIWKLFLCISLFLSFCNRAPREEESIPKEDTNSYLSNQKNKTDNKKEQVDIKPDYCLYFVQLEERRKSEIIRDYYKSGYYLDSSYRYLPLCLDGAYSELFEAVLMQVIRERSQKFFDYFTKNQFNAQEEDAVIIYFSNTIYDELSNLIEEEGYSNGNKMHVKLKEKVGELFDNFQMNQKSKVISARLKDSIIAYSLR